VIRRKTNRRHMAGDHHGRTAKRTTLLVTATDEILGTHTSTVRAGRARRLGLGDAAEAAKYLQDYLDKYHQNYLDQTAMERSGLAHSG
jgi:hypothetical protein